ncbi:MAG: T9SS type A sorting domain-containing protein [Fibrobacteria bacterium]|nr:T9SS type A sorting domain-containing protein [Fibrobacteria bacterium]
MFPVRSIIVHIIFLLFIIPIFHVYAAGISFFSDFEKDTHVIQDVIEGDSTYSYAYLQSWVDSLENTPVFGDFESVRIFYTNKGGSSHRLAHLVPDPLNSGNTVLKYWINKKMYNSYWQGRIQYAFANPHVNSEIERTGFETLHYSVKMLVPLDYQAVAADADYNLDFYIIAEFFNNAGWLTDDPDYKAFRISLNMLKPKGLTSFHFKIHGQTRLKESGWGNDAGGADLWDSLNVTFGVPLGKWITLDFFIKEGDSASGKFILKADAEEIFNIKNYTHHPEDEQPDGFNDLNTMKLYMAGTTIDAFKQKYGLTPVLYWDDFTIYDDSELKQKSIKLIDKDCGKELNNNDTTLTAPHIRSVYNPESNYQYKFRFQNTNLTDDTVILHTGDSTLVLNSDLSKKLQNNATYRVRTSIENHPYLFSYGDTDNYCEITTNFKSTPIAKKSTAELNEQLRLFPNPSGTVINVRFLVSRPDETVRMDILNEQGITVRNIFNVHFSSGEHETLLDIQALPAGTYLLRFENGTTGETRRIIHQ